MFQGLVKAALPAVATAGFMALTATSSQAFTLSSPSLESSVAGDNIEHIQWRGGGYGWRGGIGGWRRPWGWGYGYRPWGWGYGYRPWGYGFGYGWRRPWGYRWG